MGYFWIGLLAGLAAAPHCVGMCGPFPLQLARAAKERSPLLRHLLYMLGKTLTYVFLGALAGTAGHLLLRNRVFSFSQELLSYLSGGILIVIGTALLGVIPLRLISRKLSQQHSLLQSLYHYFLIAPGLSAAFILGALTGYLPCPITFLLLTSAAAAHTPLAGMALLAGLGIGTAPALLGIGFSGALLARWRHVGLRGAGVVMVVLGVITLLRPSHVLCRVLPVFDRLFPQVLG